MIQIIMGFIWIKNNNKRTEKDKHVHFEHTVQDSNESKMFTLNTNRV